MMHRGFVVVVALVAPVVGLDAQSALLSSPSLLLQRRTKRRLKRRMKRWKMEDGRHG